MGLEGALGLIYLSFHSAQLLIPTSKFLSSLTSSPLTDKQEVVDERFFMLPFKGAFYIGFLLFKDDKATRSGDDYD